MKYFILFLDPEDNVQPHEKRFHARMSSFEDYLRKLDVEDTWPIHETHCTIPKIHKPTKQEFTEKCMEPGLWYSPIYFLKAFVNVKKFTCEVVLQEQYSFPWGGGGILSYISHIGTYKAV